MYFSFLPLLIVCPLVVIFGWIAVSVLVSFEEQPPPVRCFQCGQETETSGKICEHCDAELQ